MKKAKGLTLIELIMVLAVIAIIGAILIPSFMNTTDNARLKSDVQSAMVIQNAMDLYRAERGADVTGVTMTDRLKHLSDYGYLKAGQLMIQTPGAKWEMDAVIGVVVNIADCEEENIRIKAFRQLNDQEKSYVKNGIDEA
jgi:prepilin-type N-terminal cleavage/methylation domain-containing protein